MRTPPISQPPDARYVIDRLVDAWADGRPVVPMVGLGLSAESGVMPSAGVVRYLAQVHAHISNGLLLPGCESAAIRELADGYLADPRRFAGDWGWPVPCQLERDLWLWHEAADPNPPNGVRPDFMAELVGTQLDDLARKLYPEKAQLLLEDTCLRPGRPPGHRSGFLWEALGNWRDLVRYFTGNSPARLHELLERLSLEYRPADCHVHMALLTKLLDAPLILSTAFDSLLEDALAAEGRAHQVFWMEQGTRVPHLPLGLEKLVVLKLHGSRQRPALDAPLAQPLSGAALKQLRRALPRGKPPLLLVMGCSGKEFRDIDMVRKVFLEAHQSDPCLRVAWAYYEPKAPAPVQQLQHEYGDKVAACRVGNLGQFLGHFHARLTSCHPSGNSRYLTQVRQPIGTTPYSDHCVPGRVGGVDVYHRPEKDYYLFDALGDASDKPTAATAESLPVPLPSASERLLEFAWELRASHLTIWIDLESQYTLQGVVGSLIDQCRVYDPHLAPSVLPLGPSAEGGMDDGDDGGMEKAVDSVRFALSRNRYLVAFDALETYAWPHTSHHGDPGKDKSRLKQLTRFIKRLVSDAGGDSVGGSTRRPLYGSVACAAVNPSRGRRGPTAAQDALAKCRDELLPSAALSYSYSAPSDLGVPGHAMPDASKDGLEGILVSPLCLTDLDGDQSALLLATLCCFRRTRNLVAVRAVLGPLVQSDDQARDGDFCRLDVAFGQLEDGHYLFEVQGGNFWMQRQLRDAVYERNSDLASRNNSPIDRSDEASALRRLAGVADGDELRACQNAIFRSLGQSMVLALLHNRIARYYYSENYVQSGDAAAFLEYAYHRVSCVRYLTLLLGVWGDCERSPGFAAGAAKYLSGLFARMVPGDSGARGDYLRIDRETQQALRVPGPGVAASLHQLRLDSVRSLSLTWARSRAGLQETVPAEQLISWCEQIKNDDLPRFRLDPPGDAEGVIDEFGKELSRIAIRCEYERGDFAGARDQLKDDRDWNERAIDHLKPSATRDSAGEKELKEQTDALRDVDHNRLTRFACQVEDLVRDAESTGADAVCKLEGVIRELEAVRPLYGRKSQAPFTTLRFFLIQARAHLVPARAWRNRGAKFPPEGSRPALDALDRGLDLVRHFHGKMRPSLSRRNYFMFRGLYLAERGRALCAVGRFREGYREFNYARSGLKPVDPLWAAQVELAAAEGQLMHAHDRLCAGELPKARARHTGALSCLRRAHWHLLRSRRNVVWWTELNRLASFYHSDANVLRLMDLASSEAGRYRKRDLGGVLRSLRKGLTAASFASDFQLGPTKGWPGWIQRTVLELACCAELYTRLATKSKPSDRLRRLAEAHRCVADKLIGDYGKPPLAGGRERWLALKGGMAGPAAGWTPDAARDAVYQFATERVPWAVAPTPDTGAGV